MAHVSVRGSALKRTAPPKWKPKLKRALEAASRREQKQPNPTTLTALLTSTSITTNIPRSDSVACTTDPSTKTQQKVNIAGIAHRNSTGGATLDGYLMLAASQAEDPLQVTDIEIEGIDMDSAESEDLALFTNLETANFADNRLALHTIAALPAVKILGLPCNGIVTLHALPSGSFHTLERLDLSYNEISPDSIAVLAELPHLQYLDLSYNDLPYFPDPTCKADSSTAVWFPSLEQLMLDANHLARGQLSVFRHTLTALAKLPRLSELHMQHNAILLMPVAMSTASPTGSLATGQQHEASSNTAHNGFPSLKLLDVANNRVDNVDDLAAVVVEMPVLRTIWIWGNPLTAKLHSRATGVRVDCIQRSNGGEPVELVSIEPPRPVAPAMTYHKKKMKTVNELPPTMSNAAKGADHEVAELREYREQREYKRVFLTQVEDMLNEWQRQLPANDDAVATSNACLQLDAAEEEAAIKPRDIRKAVQALRMALRHSVEFSVSKKEGSLAPTRFDRLTKAAKVRIKNAKRKIAHMKQEEAERESKIVKPQRPMADDSDEATLEDIPGTFELTAMEKALESLKQRISKVEEGLAPLVHAPSYA